MLHSGMFPQHTINIANIVAVGHCRSCRWPIIVTTTNGRWPLFECPADYCNESGAIYRLDNLAVYRTEKRVELWGGAPVPEDHPLDA